MVPRMVQMTTELEEIRTLSLLTESPQIMIRDRKYAAFAGVVLRYSDFVTILMWSIGGAQVYEAIWKEREDTIQSVRYLNPNDEKLRIIPDNSVAYHLVSKFQKILRQCSADEITDMLDNMLSTAT